MAVAQKALAGKQYLKVAPSACRPLAQRQAQPRHEDGISSEGVAWLRASFGQIGQIHPCLVRINDDGTFGILSGEKRWRAASEMPGFMLDVMAVRFDDDRVIPFILACVANGNTTPLRPLEMCDAIVRLSYVDGIPMDIIASDIFGITKPRAYQYRQLEALCPEVRHMLATRQLTERLARRVASEAKGKGEQLTMARQLAAGKAVSMLPDPFPADYRPPRRTADHAGQRRDPLARLESHAKRLDTAARALEKLLDKPTVHAELAAASPTRNHGVCMHLDSAIAVMRAARERLNKP